MSKVLSTLYLFNGAFEALRQGAFVEASEAGGEMVINFEKSQTGAVLEGIAEANDITFPSGCTKVADKQAHVFEQLTAMKLPIVDTMPESMRVKEIVAEGIKEGKSDNEMLVEIVNAGISFKNATKLFKFALEQGGYRISTKDRQELCRKALVEMDFDPKTYADVEAAIALIAQSRTDKGKEDITTAQILGAIRRYAKDKAFDLPKPEKKSTGGFRKDLFNWMAVNPTAKRSEMVKFIDGKGKDGEKVAKRFDDIFNLAKRMAQKMYEDAQ